MALDFFAGCLGGCAGVIVGHPLDTVKVHLQTQNPKNPLYKGTVHCIRTILARDGIKGIYRGVSSPLGGVAAVNAVIFGVYGNFQRNLADPGSIFSIFLAGTAAGIAQSVLTSPIELAKTRAQLSKIPKSPWEIIKNVYAKQGIRGVYKGLNITILREIPAFSTYFVTYEVITRSVSNEPIPTSTMLMAGGLAGMASWSFNYPIDVIKSRMQVDGMDGEPLKYKSSLDCLKRGVAVEGYGFLFRGLAPTLARAFPVNAVCFTVVTWTMRICEGELTIEITRDKDVQML